MATGVIVWSQTAASNSNADSSVNWAEGMAPSAVNDSARTTMASVAKWRDDLNATLIASGVSTGLTLTTNQVQGALTAGYEATFTTTFAVGTPATINVDSLGAKPLRRAPAVELQSIPAGQPIRMNYFTSNSGEWIIQAIRGITLASRVISVTATTYTPTAGMLFCIVEAVGGGGAGGGGSASDPRGAGGGGGGAYTRSILSASQISSSQVVTIGSGGSGASGSSGTDGATTTLGSLVTAPGGIGAVAGGLTLGAGGAGGSTGNGDFSMAGQAGGPGFTILISSNNRSVSGSGGISRFGMGGAASVATTSVSNPAAVAGTGFGAGGGGAATGTAVAGTGANGTGGLVTITEFV